MTMRIKNRQAEAEAMAARRTTSRVSLASKERELRAACAAASTNAEGYRIWAQGCIADPKLMRKTIAYLRSSNNDGLESDDAHERQAAEWFCSEQRLRDLADSSCSFDGAEEGSYGGGPPIFHPRYGPRESLEVVREMVRDFRVAASRTFPSREKLEDVYREATRRNIHKPYEQWTDGWSEEAWVAFLYRAGMHDLSNVPQRIGEGNWGHVLRMIISARDHFQSIEIAELRPKLRLAQRQELRSQSVAQFQAKGAAARRLYSPEDRRQWRELFSSSFANHTDRSAAQLIARKLNLDTAAVETIRKELGKKKLGSPI